MLKIFDDFSIVFWRKTSEIKNKSFKNLNKMQSTQFTKENWAVFRICKLTTGLGFLFSREVII